MIARTTSFSLALPAALPRVKTAPLTEPKPMRSAPDATAARATAVPASPRSRNAFISPAMAAGMLSAVARSTTQFSASRSTPTRGAEVMAPLPRAKRVRRTMVYVEVYVLLVLVRNVGKGLDERWQQHTMGNERR